VTELKPKAYRGFDFAETAAKNAAQRIQAVDHFLCFQGDALSPGAYEAATNFIVAHQFLHCLIGEDRKRWLGLCHEVLHKNSGSLVLSSMIGLPESVKETVNIESRINKPGNRYYAEYAEIQSELLSAGFALKEILYPEPHVAIYRAST
jgi:hypothetical protein